MLYSKALTQIQSIWLVAIIVVAATVGAAYIFLNGENQSSDTIKIGVCADLDNTYGRDTWEGAVLAAEQINAEGGILGRQVEIISEDNDHQQQDSSKVSAAMERLIHVDKVDFVVGGGGLSTILVQDISSENKIIFIQNTYTHIVA